MGSRSSNEKRFPQWEELPGGGRRYYYDVPGHAGWRARYLKEVNSDEQTLRFWQEIYNEAGKLTELHEKFPEDKGHVKLP